MSSTSGRDVAEGGRRDSDPNPDWTHESESLRQRVLRLTPQQRSELSRLLHDRRTSDSTRLVGFYVDQPGAQTSAQTLRAFLRARLPGHMIPGSLIRVESLPRTGRGKVDRSALKERLRVDRARSGERSRTSPDFRSDVESELAQIWCTALGVDRVTPTDSFFEIGGDSLLAIRVLGSIRDRWQVDMDMKDLFREPTIRGVAAAVEGVIAEGDAKGAQRVEVPIAGDRAPSGLHGSTGHRPLSPGQRRLWSLASRVPESARYNLPLAFEVGGALDVEALRAAVLSVVNRHELLRSTIVELDRSVVFGVREIDDVRVARAVFRTEVAPSEADVSWVREWVETEARLPFDLREQPPIRVRAIRLDSERHVVSVVMHHLASDGWSFETLFDELYAAYASPASLGTPPVQFAEVAEWHAEWLRGGQRDDAESFWRDLYRDPPTSLQSPEPAPDAGYTVVSVPLQGSTATALETFSAAAGVTPYVAALAMYGVVLAELAVSRDLIVCSPSSGRERSEWSRVVGYLNNVLPLRIRVDPEDSVRSHAQRVAELVYGAHGNQWLPFQDIAALPELAGVSLTRTSFVFHGQPLRSLRLPGLEIEPVPVHTGTGDFDLGLTVEATAGGFVARVVERAGVLGDAGRRALVPAYEAALGLAASDPDQRLAALAARMRSAVALGSRRAGKPARRTKRQIRRLDLDAGGWPNDPLELQLTMIWERVLGRGSVRRDADFFQMGGHSLAAVRLLEMIERELGVQLLLSDLVAHPTVRRMAGALQSRGWNPPVQSLVPLDTRGEGTPIVAVHSFEGHVFLFHELARRIGESHPVYGLQAAGIDGQRSLHATVEEMAAHYQHEVAEHFGSQRIGIVSMCFGLSVALEMAHRRRAEGLDTDLILIDGAWEHFMELSDLGLTDVGLGHRVKDKIRQVSQELRWRWLEVTGPLRSPYARREADIRRSTMEAWYRYVPQPYPGRMTLIRSRATSEEPTLDWHVRTLRSMAGGGLEVVVVPGEHFTLLREPDVGGVAEAVAIAMAREPLGTSASAERAEGTPEVQPSNRSL